MKSRKMVNHIRIAITLSNVSIGHPTVFNEPHLFGYNAFIPSHLITVSFEDH